MGAYKFETFDAEQQRPRNGIDGLRSDILERERNDAYAKGFKDGVNVTNDALETERNKLLSSIAEMLNDRSFTHKEASQGVLRSIGPLIDAVLRRTAPTIAGSAFHATLSDLVTTACKRATATDVKLIVPHGQGEALAAQLTPLHPNLVVVEDSGNGPREARIIWDGGNDHIDMDAIIGDIDKKLTEFLQSMHEGSDERARDAG